MSQGHLLRLTSEREKIGQGMSYVVKTSALETALSGLEFDVSAHIIHGGGIFFDCHLWLARKDIPYDRLYIRVGAVPNAEADRARAYMLDSVLPELVQWANQHLQAAGRPLSADDLRFLPRDKKEFYVRREWPSLSQR